MYPHNFTVIQQEIIAQLKSSEARRAMNEAVLKTAEPYVPMKSGSLRESGHVTDEHVIWSAPYARYQYHGKVYGPNNPGWLSDTVSGFRTPPGTTKHPTSRTLGEGGTFTLYPMFGRKFSKEPFEYTSGYSTPNTKHHWIKEMMNNSYRVLQQRITANLKRVLKHGR